MRTLFIRVIARCFVRVSMLFHGGKGSNDLRNEFQTGDDISTDRSGASLSIAKPGSNAIEIRLLFTLL